jgi:hypothetical protein
VTASSTSPITGVTVIAAQILTPHEKGRSGVVFEGIDAAETSHVTSFRVSRQASGLLVKSCGNRRSGRLQGLGKHLPIGCQPCNTGANAADVDAGGLGWDARHGEPSGCTWPRPRRARPVG